MTENEEQQLGNEFTEELAKLHPVARYLTLTSLCGLFAILSTGETQHLEPSNRFIARMTKRYRRRDQLRFLAGLCRHSVDRIHEYGESMEGDDQQRRREFLSGGPDLN